MAKTVGADTFWNFYTQEFGAMDFPANLSVCTGKKYFYEVKGGAKMQSALDRKHMRILRRENKLKYLMHELAHVYLDLRWQVLPYHVSEPLVAAMEVPEKCQLPKFVRVGREALNDRWNNRKALSRCELIGLLRDIFFSETDLRSGLLLR